MISAIAAVHKEHPEVGLSVQHYRRNRRGSHHHDMTHAFDDIQKHGGKTVMVRKK